MKSKKISKKLVFNKTIIASLNNDQLSHVKGGRPFPVPISVGCVYTEGCTGWGCPESVLGDNCIYTNFGDMMGCPETMTLCGELYCP